MQTRFGSFVESLTNITVGATIGFLANITILPLFGYPVTLGDGLAISLVFTGISLIRQYIIRRWFAVKQLFTVGKP